MVSRLLARLPVALLIALAVSMGLGAAFANTTDASADPSIAVPHGRLGDAGSYKLTMVGDWDRPDVASTGRGQAPYKQPWTALDFDWRDGGIGQDAQGARAPWMNSML